MARASSTQMIPSLSTTPASAAAAAAAAATTTTTVILEEMPSSSSSQRQPQITESLVLKLKPPKKKVSWKEGTVDNEFMNKKSSKKCCIFHKEKPFDEDDSDAEGDTDHDHNGGRNNGGVNELAHQGDGNCCHSH